MVFISVIPLQRKEYNGREVSKDFVYSISL